MLVLLATCLAVLAAAAVVGVRVLDQEPTVTLLANWTGDDARHLRQSVLTPFERSRHVRVDYQGSSAESQVLGADVEAGTPPDVVVLTGPGELADYARKKRLVPLDGLLPEGRFGASWATPLDGHVYWFPLKADVKSVVWYPGASSEREVRAAAARPGSWCLGMGSGATSGWPGTDWIEDILLQRSGWQAYDRWARGRLPWRSDEVRQAWRTWAALVGAGGDRELTARALRTEYQDASRLLDRDPPACTLEHQASFVRSAPAWRDARGAYLPSAALIPGARPSTAGTWEVSGDLVALLHDTPAARKLVRYLASTGAQQAWTARESGFSVAAGTDPAAGAADGAAGSWHRSLARTLLDPRAVHCFDASDAMPPSVRDAFTEATLQFLADPDRLEGLLRDLDRLAGDRSLTWLPSVCDRDP
uniref:extracellular solute-binding protein n=1 Tax=Streptomyces corallincola TaxID=2851888 RepID=UPI0027E238E8|nr:extracellular solute-binding protein [Streptomyces corallincola]